MSADSSPTVSDFADPPLTEVVFSVEFDGDVIDEVGILSEFWRRIDDEFPRHEKQPPILQAAESFDVPPTPPDVPIQLMSGLPGQRYWFLTEDQTLIVQVQADRLMFNWRQVVGDEPYPRYATLAPRFADLLRIFLACDAVDTEIASVAWVELQYVNPIPAEGEHGTHGQLARILNFLVPDPPRDALPAVEDTQVQQRFRITGDDGDPQGAPIPDCSPGFPQHRPDAGVRYYPSRSWAWTPSTS
jgi:uncharacterized protein (TIGR04255 family)